jgi:hypothetical protein
MDRQTLKEYQEILIKNLKEQFSNGDISNSYMIETIVSDIFKDIKEQLPIKNRRNRNGRS